MKSLDRFNRMSFLLIGMWLSYFSLLAQPSAATAYAAQNRGQHSEAIAAYDSLWQAGFESVDLHYNLSLAHYANGDLGKAMWHLEKAARLKPYDREVQTNLRLLRNEQTDGILPRPTFFLKDWALSIGARLGVEGWGALALLLITLAALLLIGGLKGWQLPLRKWWPFLAALCVVLSVLSVGLAAYRQAELARTDQAVLLPVEASPVIAPDADATSEFTIHAGLRLHILDRFEGWVKVQLPDGREGWLPQAAVGEI